jgi:hypothetical protein
MAEGEGVFTRGLPLQANGFRAVAGARDDHFRDRAGRDDCLRNRAAIKPLERLGPVGSVRCRTFTSGLST